MATLQTRFFGQLEYNEEAVITIPSGLPPFAGTRYLLLGDESRKPLVFLQSIEEPKLCFLSLPVRSVDPGYDLRLEPEYAAGLSPGDWTWLAILTIPESGPVTANLMAPVVIDPARRVGVQAIRTASRYSHVHPVSAGEEAACSS